MENRSFDIHCKLYDLKTMAQWCRRLWLFIFLSVCPLGYGCPDRLCIVDVFEQYVQAEQTEKIQAAITQHPELLHLQFPCASKQTFLHLAAGMGNVPMCRILIEHGADVDARDSVGSTPLHVAAVKGFLDVVACLIKCDADIHVRAAFPVYTPLLGAVSRGHFSVVKFLCSHGVDLDDAFYVFYARSSYTSDRQLLLQILKYLLQQGLSVIDAAQDDIHDPLASMNIEHEREALGKALEEINDETKLSRDLNQLILLFLSQYLRLPASTDHR